MRMASLRASAKTATAPLLRRAVRLKQAPSALGEWRRVSAHMRRMAAIRLAPKLFGLFLSTLPAEKAILGLSRNQETK